MKTFKKLLLGLFVFVMLFVLTGFFLPSQINLERKLVIDAPIAMVYEAVDNLHQWERWSPWHKIDPNMGITYANFGIGKGASYSWTSDHESVGNGTLTITDNKAFEYIETSMDFGENGVGTAGFTFSEIAGKVLVSWDMHSDAGNGPIARWIGVLMKMIIEKSYDEGLADLDAHCQELKKKLWFPVSLEDRGLIKYYGISSNQVRMLTMERVMKDSFTKIGNEIATADIETSGSPFAIFHSWGEAYDMECGMPVEDNGHVINGLEQKQLLAKRYAVLKYTGTYVGMEKAHEYLMQWLDDSNLELAGPILEVYKTSPKQMLDNTKWNTYILYPIQ